MSVSIQHNDSNNEIVLVLDIIDIRLSINSKVYQKHLIIFFQVPKERSVVISECVYVSFIGFTCSLNGWTDFKYEESLDWYLSLECRKP